MRKGFKNIKDGLLSKRGRKGKTQLFMRNSDQPPEHKPEILFTEDKPSKQRKTLFKKDKLPAEKKARRWKPTHKELGIVAAAVLVLVVVPTMIIIASGKETETSAGESQQPVTPVQAQTEPTMTPQPTPTEKPLHPNDVVFTEGTEAGIVADIQQRLMDLGYMDLDEPTTLYGPATAGAVKLFQRKHELTIDGQMGKETYATLISESAKKYSVGIGNEGTDIYELQVRLRELDYIDKATNYYGTETEAAVKKFQLRNDLEADGTVGETTREMLYSDQAKANVLAYGEESEDIYKIQNKLQKLGYLATTPDGKYGDDTVAAVKRFQERNSIIADGYLGQETRSMLFSDDAQANGLAIGMGGTDVENMQKLLISLNYLKSADGYFGEATQNAVRNFQQRNNLTVDGKVGAETLNAMKDNDAVAAAKPNTSSSSGSGNASSGGNSSSSGSGNSSSGGSSAPAPSGSGVEAFIAAAQSRLGMKYVRGGKGPSTFDCSGFVYWCLNQAGVSQSYMTSATWQGVTKYKRIGSLSEVQRGDVISFKGHVGIAIGGGQMIDASSSQGKVRIANLGSPYWSRNFVAAFRIF